MSLWNNSRREYFLLGVLVGVVLAVAAALVGSVLAG